MSPLRTPKATSTTSQTNHRGDAMLRILSSSLNPDQADTPRCLIDPILISIDVGLTSDGILNEVGIASLDTRLLSISRTNNLITAWLLLQRRRSIPLSKRTRQYIYSIAEYCPPACTCEELKKLFCQVDSESGVSEEYFLGRTSSQT